MIISYAPASPLARVAVAASVAVFGLGTTAGLHWFTSPYVHCLYLNRDEGRLRARTLSLLGRPINTEFELADVSQPDTLHPLATFAARGRLYCVDVARFASDDALRTLMPWLVEKQADGGEQAGGGSSEGQQQQ